MAIAGWSRSPSSKTGSIGQLGDRNFQHDYQGATIIALRASEAVWLPTSEYGKWWIASLHALDHAIFQVHICNTDAYYT